MKKVFLLIAVVFIALSAHSFLAFSQEDQAAKELAVEKLLRKRVAVLYEKAVSFYNEDKLKAADDSFMMILEIDPNHKGANLYLYEKIPDRIAKQKVEAEELKIQEELARKKPTKKNVDAFYKKTVALYKKNKLDKAKKFFTKILEIDPNHKGAKLYLDQKIPNKLERARLKEELRLEGFQRQEEIAGKKAEREKALSEQKALKEEALTLEEAPLEELEVLVGDVDAALEEQFAKQEAILEETTRIYKEQMAAKGALAQEVQETPEEPAVEGEKPAIDYEYRIGPGDSLEISLYGEPDMKQSTKVSEDGVITYPFLGAIEVKGLSAQEVEAKVEELLGKEYFVNPQVSVTIKVYAKFNILGEVRRPGSYEISGPMTVIDAIAVAGGFTDIASRNKVKVVRKDGDQTKIIKVPVYSILKTGNSSKNVYLKKGDTIVVPESFF